MLYLNGMKKLSIVILLFNVLCINAQDTLRVGEVFDFDIGDEFHYERTLSQLNGIQVDRIFIEDKWYSDQQDTLFYKIRKNQYSDFQSSPGPSGMWYDVNQYYTHLDTFVWLDVFSSNPCGNSDTCVVTTEFDTYCDRQSMRVSLRTGLIDFEENTEINAYAIGLGVVFNSDYQDDGNTGTETQLVYYKKGTEECGAPNYLTNIEETKPNPSILTYPNPFHDKLFFEFDPDDDEHSNIEIYDLYGNLTFSNSKLNNNLTIETKSWESGIYFFQYRRGDTFITSKLVKEE